MTLGFASFVAGLLTILAPCVLPLLPVIVGSSLGSKSKYRVLWIMIGLIGSITIFTLILRASTLLISIDPLAWKIISGGILIALGITYIYPTFWDKLSVSLNFSPRSQQLLDKANSQEGIVGAILTGGALGPVFTSCSPTYFFIIATILPANYITGVLYILLYSLGLAVMLGAIALLGRNLTRRLSIIADPEGNFKKILGVVFVLIGLAVIAGLDKSIETAILDSGLIDGILDFESRLLE